VAHSYLAKSDLDKLIIDGDKDMLKIFNSMGISTTHIKELKTMLKNRILHNLAVQFNTL
jgi:hypothetical protein